MRQFKLDKIDCNISNWWFHNYVYDEIIVRLDRLQSGYKTLIIISLIENKCWMKFISNFDSNRKSSTKFNYCCEFTLTQFKRCCNAIKWICVQNMVNEILDGIEWVDISFDSVEEAA